MSTQYGSVEAYIRDELGMDEANIAQLKAHFLE
jgi:hypothetical protein